MLQMAGIIRHEAGMMLARKAMWLSYGFLYLFYGALMVVPGSLEHGAAMGSREVWQAAGRAVFTFNMFMVLVGGILAADALERDYRMGVRELQQSAPVGRMVYILGKYFGMLAAVLLPYLVWILIAGAIGIGLGEKPIGYIGALLVAFAAMSVPACAFVVAFSLACPLVMPVRVYQILFTGYWFWGNYLNPKAFPTLNGTILTPGGTFALQGFFGGFSTSGAAPPGHSAAEAWLNLAVLALCAAAVLAAVDFFLARQARRA